MESDLPDVTLSSTLKNVSYSFHWLKLVSILTILCTCLSADFM